MRWLWVASVLLWLAAGIAAVVGRGDVSDAVTWFTFALIWFRIGTLEQADG